MIRPKLGNLQFYFLEKVTTNDSNDFCVGLNLKYLEYNELYNPTASIFSLIQDNVHVCNISNKWWG